MAGQHRSADGGPESLGITYGEGLLEAQAAQLPSGVRLLAWLQALGRGSWLLVGIAVLVAIILFVLGLVSDLLIPLIFAAILASILVPLVDRLERWHVSRRWGSPLVVLLVLATVLVVFWLVISQIIHQGSQILDKLTAGIDTAGSGAGLSQADQEQAAKIAGQIVVVMGEGVLKGLGSVTVLIVAVVVGVFFMFFLMKDWRFFYGGAARQLTTLFGLPAGVGDRILSDAVHSFRGYAWGLTIIGVMNGAVVGVGALLLGVPLAGAIAIVTFVTSYIPFFGAFFAGAFAVLIALGAKGIGVAVAMLAIVLLSQNTLQNLLEPFAFGRALAMHPLLIMLVSTGGALLFGVLGATLAPPLTAVAIRTVGVLRDANVIPGPAPPPTAATAPEAMAPAEAMASAPATAPMAPAEVAPAPATAPTAPATEGSPPEPEDPGVAVAADAE